MNSIELHGRIKSIYNGAKNTVVTLYIKGENRRGNFPQVIFSNARRSLVDGFEEGDFVKIEGVLKTRGERLESGRILHHQFIRGEDIILFSDVDEKDFKYINECNLTGKIVRAKEDVNMVTLLVHPDNENFNLWAFKYTPDTSIAMSEFQEGCSIDAVCEMQTVRKEIRGEVKFFENLVIKSASVSMD